MKKIIFFALAALTLAACQKQPYPVDRDGEFMVYTVMDKETEFETALKYFVPEEVRVVVDKDKVETSTSPDALSLVEEVKRSMTAYGYEEAATKEEADLGLQLTYMEETVRYLQYVSDPYWWLNSGYWGPGYWGPGYWGNWYGYSYYPVTYSTSTTTFVVDMMDLRAGQGEGKKLPVVWSAFIGGVTGNYINNDIRRLKAGINQAFAQSEYLRKADSSK